MSDVSVKFGAEDIGLEKTLKSVQAELGNLQDKVKSGDLSMTDLERSMKRVGQLESLEKRLQGMGTEAAQTSPKMDTLGKDMKQMGDKATDAGEKGSISFAKLASASAAGGLAVAGFTKVLDLAMDGARMVAEKFGDALDMGGRLSDLSARTGETAGNMLILERAFENAGTSAENVGPAINKLQRFMDDAANGGKKQTEAMDRLGISMDDLQGKTPTQQMEVFAKKIAAIKDPTERTALAVAVFGKNGGELLPFLRNFASEIENAKKELGSLPKIMDESSEKFDTISDKMQIVKGKFTEFAAGIIDRVLPALELFTVSFAKIDAAGLGQKLADAFIGGRQAMQGFTAALDAISIGDFSSAFKIAFMSIELQLKQTANEIWKNLQAAFSASAQFLGDILGPSSGVYFAVKLTFENMGKTISISIAEGIAGALGALGPLGGKLATGIRENVEIMRRSMDINSDMISVAMGRITEDLSEAGQKFPNTFKDAYNNAKPLFDVTQDAENLAAKIDEISQKKIISDEAKKSLSTAGDEFLELQNAINPLEVGFGQVEASADDAGDSVSELNRAIDILPTKKEVKVEAKIDKAQQFEKDVNDLLNIINGVPDAKTVSMAIDAGNFKDLNDLKKQVEFFPDSKQVKMVLEQLGINLDELKTAINGLPEEKRSKIAMDVFGNPDLERAGNLLGAINNKTIQAAAKVFGVDSVQELSNAIRGIPEPKLVEAVFKATGADNVSRALIDLDTLSSKERKALLEMTGLENINAVKNALNGIKDEEKIKKAVEVSGLKDVNELKAAIDMVLQQTLKPADLKVDTQQANADLGSLESKMKNLKGEGKLGLKTDDADAAISSIESAMGYLSGVGKLGLKTDDADAAISSIKSAIKNLSGDVTLTLNADASIKSIRNQLSQSLDVNFNNGGSGKGSMDINLTTDGSSLETLVDAIRGYVESINGKLPLHALGY